MVLAGALDLAARPADRVARLDLLGFAAPAFRADADRLVGRLAERVRDRLRFAAGFDFHPRLPFDLAISEPFETLTVCR